MTRVQKERLDPSEYANVKAQFILRSSDLTGARDNLKVLHPLPRIDEITTDVDKTPTPTISNKRVTVFLHVRRYWHWY